VSTILKCSSGARWRPLMTCVSKSSVQIYWWSPGTLEGARSRVIWLPPTSVKHQLHVDTITACVSPTRSIRFLRHTHTYSHTGGFNGPFQVSSAELRFNEARGNIWLRPQTHRAN